MKVEMQPASTWTQLQAVFGWARQGGFEVQVVDSDGAPTIGVEGAVSDEQMEALRRLPGVAGVTPADPFAAEKTSDLRIEAIRPLISPAILLEEQPLTPEQAAVVRRGREEIVRILN